MTSEQLDGLLERACGSPHYTDLCIALSLWERDQEAQHNEADREYLASRRCEQIGRLLIDVVISQQGK